MPELWGNSLMGRRKKLGKMMEEVNRRCFGCFWKDDTEASCFCGGWLLAYLVDDSTDISTAVRRRDTWFREGLVSLRRFQPNEKGEVLEGTCTLSNIIKPSSPIR